MPRKRKAKTPSSEGIVYVLVIELDDESGDTKTAIKIGMTRRKDITKRVAEIAVAVYHKYRFFPKIFVKRFRWTDEVAEKEKILHKKFKEYSYKPVHKFGGSGELFCLPLDTVVDAYDDLVKPKAKPKKKKGVFFSSSK